MKKIRLLNSFQKNILRLFFQVKESKFFFLTGGTALSAFYLRHRESEDFDFFTGEPKLVDITGDAFVCLLRERGIKIEVLRRSPTFYEFIPSQKGFSFKVQLAQDSPFRLGVVRKTKEGFLIDNLDDIAANKFLTVYGRGAPRDFVDVYCLIQSRHYSFEDLFKIAKRKDPSLDSYFLALALQKVSNFPDSIRLLPVAMLKPLNIKAMKTFFLSKATELLLKSKPRS